MREYKVLSCLSSFISLISFVCTLCTHGKESVALLYNISLAIFGSSLVSFVMSLIGYFANRRKAMELFSFEAKKVVLVIGNLVYFNPTKSNIDECIDKYLCFIETDLSSFSNAYGGLDFFFNAKMRAPTAKSIYTPIIEAYKKVVQKDMIFNIYKSGGVSKESLSSILCDFNDYWFSYIHTQDNLSGSILMKKLYNDLMNAIEKFRCSIYHITYIPIYSSISSDKEPKW